MGNAISVGEADLILEKLYSEAVPVVAYYVRAGVKVMRHGIVTGVSPEFGLVVSDDKESVVQYDYLAISLGSPTGASCTFWYGDVRELPDETSRAETVEKLGESVLLIECGDGGKLRLYFSL
jgi:NADPH-dependent 2,4-dienoyl-CoA reductase/sulfur reductase-like enzyme